MNKRALISVSDKSGIEEFARALTNLGYEILSTGGTEKALTEAKIQVTPVEDITQFPECFGGRVKTMHPMIMGGVLFRRDNKQDQKEAVQHGIGPIDIVVVNLYPFEETAKKGDATYAELIEKIDIGGPTLLRSAAKNHADVTVVCDPADYDRVLEELQSEKNTSDALRKELALKVFTHTAAYDSAIAQTLSENSVRGLILTNGMNLRYGENPHQWGQFFDFHNKERTWQVLQEEKQMSYLNILDADGAMNLVCEFPEPAAACIKHANPSGVASHSDIAEAFQRSYDADRLSAFGVIIAFNRECPKEVVEKILEQKIFAEVLIAPSFSKEALELLRKKPKIRVLQCKCPQQTEQITYRSMLGGILVQDADTKVVTREDLTCVTDVKPTDAQIEDLLFAWKVVKHAKSNAIVFAKNNVTTGIGCGQTSRVDSTVIAAGRAADKAKGSVMASDAFFPFPDSVEEAARNGIVAIIQPGGSIRDDEVIAKANTLCIPMVTTGIRGFRH
ncbi:bifunctional phosphoribosylaminoimidazolecarboxamide formyltransferase/inosine monophosphate cyclohydrolase [Candidatus Peregrinibacteria bacterium CG10_big_fil_rev_8_21_14_0_10_49_24]|nr:MAG: bifunctional phosphoribosylaminoimidazolecarboxamide formyltransferase/inosine monophosphate cyclohydrolase [Candidatus Peregrinibacteria bacterium CG11_big_fil_rev_8_21_14_0_20_49_14]PIR50456.1 MAG: bifunctional phosphoribosylaminoimidazolecarboxamide formyltransferase/inosine monophosphate cyclohydrolase [Candidatus Peregrinibacteria bacterium CG10_big_fil_rev_8_21_14_0_10_49_24]PJA68292.1 MAG: bifunctional phosphoribosylaminoimidazolecarboxamide formyltransferase/inosine monophosphate 